MMSLQKYFLLCTFVLSPLCASAAGLSVVFEKSPLFGEAQFMPGTTVSRAVTVTNTDTVAHVLYTRATSTVRGGLEEALDLTITSPTAHFNNTLAAYYATSSVRLGTLAAGEAKTYTFGATFRTGAADAYQGKTTRFDIEVGFEGGEVVTDTSGTPSGSTGGSVGGTFGVGGSGENAGRVLGDSVIADIADTMADVVASSYDAGTKAVARVLGAEDVVADAVAEADMSASITDSKPTAPPSLANTDTHCTTRWLIALGLMLLAWLLLEVWRSRMQEYVFSRIWMGGFLIGFAAVVALIAFLGFPCSIPLILAVIFAFVLSILLV